MDIAANCSELYNNLIVLEAAYKLESAAWQTNYTAYCGLEGDFLFLLLFFFSLPSSFLFNHRY